MQYPVHFSRLVLCEYVQQAMDIYDHDHDTSASVQWSNLISVCESLAFFCILVEIKYKAYSTHTQTQIRIVALCYMVFFGHFVECTFSFKAKM